MPASLLLLGALVACAPAPSRDGEGAKGEGGSSPETVCQHVREVAAKDTDDAAILDQVQRECVKSLESMQSRYRTFTTCVELAGTSAALYQCEESLTKPASLLASASPTAKLEALCDHVINLLQTEMPQMAATMDQNAIAQLREKCITDAGAQIETRGADVFNREADCILAAHSLAELEACGPSGGAPPPPPGAGGPPPSMQPPPSAPPTATVEPALPADGGAAPPPL